MDEEKRKIEKKLLLKIKRTTHFTDEFLQEIWDAISNGCFTKYKMKGKQSKITKKVYN